MEGALATHVRRTLMAHAQLMEIQELVDAKRADSRWAPWIDDGAVEELVLLID